LGAALDRYTRAGEYAAALAVANALDDEASHDRQLDALRVAILRDLTVEPLLPALRAELAANGFAADVWIGGFDTIAQDALSPSNGLDRVRVAKGVKAGVLSVNSNSSVHTEAPFGGYKMSGIGRELGMHALDLFTEVKNVFVDLT
jgi:hypothetical protein